MSTKYSYKRSDGVWVHTDDDPRERGLLYRWFMSRALNRHYVIKDGKRVYDPAAFRSRRARRMFWAFVFLAVLALVTLASQFLVAFGP